MSRRLPVALPCVGCAHGSVCCSWGTMLTEEEKDQVVEAHGPEVVRWVEGDAEWRTSLVGGRCVFSSPDRGCVIHEAPYYPVTCRNFPWLNTAGTGPYEYDLSICPELRE